MSCVIGARALVRGSRGVDPTEDSEGAECVPAAGLADGFGEWEGERFGVGIIEEPTAVGLPFGADELGGFGEAWVGFGFGLSLGVEVCGAEVVECAEDVVVVARREGEFQEFGACDFAGRAAAEERAGEEIFFGAAASGGDFCRVLGVCLPRICVRFSSRRADGAFVFE